MTDRSNKIVDTTLKVGALYCLATLLLGFLGMTLLSGMAMGEAFGGRHNGTDSAEGAFVFILAIVQPVVVFIGWLGTKSPSVREHFSLFGLVMISCVWSLVVGFGYALFKEKTEIRKP